ncbi:hypothetical protein D5085_04050 [Ectothiorhodospiraceae bacterium BW-2]|nr:hypothetical protein D5085_04050 [Ectothiorhodospiraceae bacterium BW-2]
MNHLTLLLLLLPFTLHAGARVDQKSLSYDQRGGQIVFHYTLSGDAGERHTLRFGAALNGQPLNPRSLIGNTQNILVGEPQILVWSVTQDYPQGLSGRFTFTLQSDWEQSHHYPFTIQTEPANARVRIMNITEPYRPGMELPDGDYYVEVSAEGRDKWLEWVKHGGQTTVKEVALSGGNEPFTDPTTGMTFVYIKGGRYRMGSPTDETGRDGDESQHWVTVGDFWIATTEVTNQQYRLFKRDHDSQEYEGHSLNGDKQPVVYVSWEEATDYAAWLSQKSGKSYRLPTEAEWEYAARGGTTTAYWWGDGVGRNNANCDGCGSQWDNKSTAPVVSFKPNPYGLYDTAGNVWEWTCSGYDSNYKNNTETSCKNRADSGNRAFRGGSWGYVPAGVRAASRGWSDPGLRGDSHGFRLVLPPR